MTPKNIVLIHAMFQNSLSGIAWVHFVEARGYSCTVPDWPLHAGEPKALRAKPSEELGDSSLDEILVVMDAVVRAQPEPPILVGHSVDGPIVQILAARGIGSMVVLIDGGTPYGMMTLDWEFLKNSALIGNSLKGNEPFFTDFDLFKAGFCNAMTEAEA